MISRRRFLVALGGATTLSQTAFAADSALGPAPPLPTFGIVFHRPTNGDEAHAFLHETSRAMTLARSIYAPVGFDLAVDVVLPLDESHHRIENVATRDTLAPLVRGQRINVFLVEALRDAEVKDLYRLGVTWDSRVAPLRRYIILTRGARESSLAHELGHFFGIPEHSATKNNLMSYDRDDALVFLDDAQNTRIRAGAARLLGSHAQAAI
ncbi:hypothetical protein BH09MYX1_BH09MYX1_18210 [soil metagenome]